MTFIKEWIASEENKTGCRFLVVDAYNKENVLNFYEKHNDFSYLIENEKLELDAVRGSNKGITELRTRKMYFDLIRVKPKEQFRQ